MKLTKLLSFVFGILTICGSIYGFYTKGRVMQKSGMTLKDLQSRSTKVFLDLRTVICIRY